jgi:hypothetical protein
MKNTPNKIFLNIGTDEKDLDFNTLAQVTWSEDRVFDSDLEFISVSFLLAEIHKMYMEEDVSNSNALRIGNKILILNKIQNLLK